MRFLEAVKLSPISLLSRPPEWERVPDRAGEGSLPATEMLVKILPPTKEEPSSSSLKRTVKTTTLLRHKLNGSP
jgi:hypothetical protein